MQKLRVNSAISPRISYEDHRGYDQSSEYIKRNQPTGGICLRRVEGLCRGRRSGNGHVCSWLCRRHGRELTTANRSACHPPTYVVILLFLKMLQDGLCLVLSDDRRERCNIRLLHGLQTAEML